MYHLAPKRTGKTSRKNANVSFFKDIDKTEELVYSALFTVKNLRRYNSVSKKTHQLWNGRPTARYCKDQFWWHLAGIFKRL